jgi:hypothetical protein
MVIFHLKFISNSIFFKMPSVRVHFSPGFPLGGRFPAEQNTHVVLCVNKIPPEQKKRFLRCSAYFEYHQSKNQTVCSPGNSPLCGNPNTAEQFSLEHPPSNSSRTLQEQPLLSSCGLLPPHWSKLLCGKSSS